MNRSRRNRKRHSPGSKLALGLVSSRSEPTAVNNNSHVEDQVSASYAASVDIVRQGDRPATLKIQENRSRYEYRHDDLYYANAKARSGVKNEPRSASPDPKCAEGPLRRNSGDGDK